MFEPAPFTRLSAALLMASALASCRNGEAVSLESTRPAAFTEQTDAWHAERLANLAAPDGWLSLVALEWLDDGPNRVGRAPHADVVYDGFPVDHVATIVVEGQDVRLETVEGVELAGTSPDGVVRTDADGAPTILALGGIRFHVISRGGRLAVRIKDAAAPARTDFAGIDRSPVDAAWRITAEFEPAPDDATIVLDTVIGFRQQSDVIGRVRFACDGVRVDAVLVPAADGGAYLRFADATNGVGTYSGGRYLYVEPTRDGRTVFLDFNRAFNPPCAFTPFATCSIPPASNRLPFPVNAGERWQAHAE